MHAPSANPPSKPPRSAPKRISRSQALWIQIPLANIQRSPLPTDPSPSRRPVDLILVFKSRRREIANRKRQPRARGQRIVKGIGPCRGRPVFAQRVVLGRRMRGIATRSRLAAAVVRAGGWGRGRGGVVFIAFFLQAGRDFLDDAEFVEGAEVGEAAGGDEEVLEGAGDGFGVVVVGRAGRSVREAGEREEVLEEDVEGVDAVVADAEGVDHGFVAEAGNFDEVFERRLRVRVAEGVGGGGGGVPLAGEGGWVCGFAAGF